MNNSHHYAGLLSSARRWTGAAGVVIKSERPSAARSAVGYHYHFFLSKCGRTNHPDKKILTLDDMSSE